MDLLHVVVAAVLSGAVASALIGVIFTRHVTQVQHETKSRRVWKEQAVAQLLGPISMQLDRTKRAFDRWDSKNLYLEAAVVHTGNKTIRDLLLARGHLIPPELMEDAGKLIEHYDVWLEKFDQQRGAQAPDLEAPFVFVGPDGYPFPRKAADRFQEAFGEYWKQLYRDG